MSETGDLYYLENVLTANWLEWGGEQQPQDIVEVPEGFRLEVITSPAPPLDLDIADDGGVTLNDAHAHADLEAIVRYEKANSAYMPLSEPDQEVWLLGRENAEALFLDRYRIDQDTFDVFKAHYQELWRQQNPDKTEQFEAASHLRRVK